MKLIIKIIGLFFLVSCSSRSGTKKEDSKTYEQDPIVSNKIVMDTIDETFPVGIGNDKGTIRVIGVRTFKNRKLIDSDFLILLHDIPNIATSEKLNKDILIDSNTTVLLKDSLHYDFLNTAIIKKVHYDAVRLNTVYFKAVLENPKQKKKITGRFGLLYNSKKKKKFYGWITDEIQDIDN
ncbi:hypothetical protein [Aquimarina sp. SS2-1]|uniref:hypothetical protein n=1 Tax=Aquimarina besae TaxID=3342247 RepID=UPI0036710B3C